MHTISRPLVAALLAVTVGVLGVLVADPAVADTGRATSFEAEPLSEGAMVDDGHGEVTGPSDAGAPLEVTAWAVAVLGAGVFTVLTRRKPGDRTGRTSTRG